MATYSESDIVIDVTNQIKSFIIRQHGQ